MEGSSTSRWISWVSAVGAWGLTADSEEVALRPGYALHRVGPDFSSWHQVCTSSPHVLMAGGDGRGRGRCGRRPRGPASGPGHLACLSQVRPLHCRLHSTLEYSWPCPVLCTGHHAVLNAAMPRSLSLLVTAFAALCPSRPLLSAHRSFLCGWTAITPVRFRCLHASHADGLRAHVTTDGVLQVRGSRSAVRMLTRSSPTLTRVPPGRSS